MQRWDDLTPEEKQRYLTAEELWAQLATVTAERDDYRARFRDLEHELQLERGQVVAQQQRREAAEAALVRANDKIKQIEQRLGIYST